MIAALLMFASGLDPQIEKAATERFHAWHGCMVTAARYYAPSTEREDQLVERAQVDCGGPEDSLRQAMVVMQMTAYVHTARDRQELQTLSETAADRMLDRFRAKARIEFVDELRRGRAPSAPSAP